MTSLIIAFIAMVATIICTIITYLSYKNNNSPSTELNLNSKNNYETNINSKNNYEYHEHNHYEKNATYVTNNNSTTSNNSNDEIWVIMAVFALAVIVAIFQFVIHKKMIIMLFYSVTILVSIIWLLIIFIRFRGITSKDKVYLILIKSSMLLPIVIVQYNLFAPSNYAMVEKIILESNGTGIIAIFFDLLKTNDLEVFYIVFQVLGLIVVPVALFLNYTNLFYIIKYNQPHKILSRSKILIYFLVISILFSSGIISRLIMMFQNMV